MKLLSLLCLSLVAVTSTVQAKDSLVMTCNWHGIKTVYASPSECMTKEAFDSIKSSSFNGTKHHTNAIVQRSNPGKCPNGYTQYGELLGGIIGGIKGIKVYESRRLCLSE